MRRRWQRLQEKEQHLIFLVFIFDKLSKVSQLKLQTWDNKNNVLLKKKIEHYHPLAIPIPDELVSKQD